MLRSTTIFLAVAVAFSLTVNQDAAAQCARGGSMNGAMPSLTSMRATQMRSPSIAGMNLANMMPASSSFQAFNSMPNITMLHNQAYRQAQMQIASRQSYYQPSDEVLSLRRERADRKRQLRADRIAKREAELESQRQQSNPRSEPAEPSVLVANFRTGHEILIPTFENSGT